jgi:hypothetical protein
MRLEAISMIKLNCKKRRKKRDWFDLIGRKNMVFQKMF